ncbi:hypothetical protein VM1G_11723 [Cytospora mali]|uniref:AA1-like domain-containing protein n=1 Tax=Cytospora mali TaxID=578113 RepID=A0A194W1W1_CYTMA|nr:hypothetical protein VM1G_11723 [Valsa mali]
MTLTFASTMRFLGPVVLIFTSLTSATPVALTSERQSWRDTCTAALPSQFTIFDFSYSFDHFNPETDSIDFSFVDNNLISTTCHWNWSSAIVNPNSNSNDAIYACDNPSVRFGFSTNPAIYLNIYEVICSGTTDSEVHGGTPEFLQAACVSTNNGGGRYSCALTPGSTVTGDFTDLGPVQS